MCGIALCLSTLIRLLLQSCGVDCLGQAGLAGGHVAPLLDNGLLDLPGVLPGPGAHLLGDVHALLVGLEQGHQLGDVPAGTLGLQVASLLGDLLDNSLLLVKALLRAGSEDTARGTAKLPGDLLTLRLGGELGDALGPAVTDLPGPLGTLLLGGVTLGDILALLLLDGLALNDVIINLVLVVAGLTLGLVDGLTLLGALTLADQRGVAEPDGLLEGNLLVLDEARLLEVLVTLLLLLGLEVSGVGGVAPLRVAMVALNLLVVLGLLNHDDLVDTTLSSGGNGADVEGGAIIRALPVVAAESGPPLAGGAVGLLVVLVVVMVVVVLVVSSLAASAGVEGEGVRQVAALATLQLGLGPLGRGGGDHEGQDADLADSNHD